MPPAWTSRSILACLLLLSACPSDPDPQPAEDSSSGPGGSTSTGMETTPQPSTTAADTSTGPDVTSSTGPDVTSSTGPDDTTGHQHTTGPDDTTTGGSSSGDSSTSGSSSSEGSSSGDPTTGGAIDCSIGDGPDFAVGNNGAADYVIDGVNDPGITVVRGCSYTFTVNAPGHPFLIKTVQSTGLGNQYNDGVTNNGTQNGVITWDVPASAPDALFYICQFHAGMTNTITVIDP